MSGASALLRHLIDPLARRGLSTHLHGTTDQNMWLAVESRDGRGHGTVRCIRQPESGDTPWYQLRRGDVTVVAGCANPEDRHRSADAIMRMMALAYASDMRAVPLDTSPQPVGSGR